MRKLTTRIQRFLTDPLSMSPPTRRLMKNLRAWVDTLTAEEMVLAGTWALYHKDKSADEAEKTLATVQRYLRVGESNYIRDYAKKVGVMTHWEDLGHLRPLLIPIDRAPFDNAIISLEHAVLLAVTGLFDPDPLKSTTPILEKPVHELMNLVDLGRKDPQFAELALALAPEFTGTITELVAVHAAVRQPETQLS